YPDADRGDLAFSAARVGGNPHPAAALDPAARHAERVAHVDQGLFEPAYVVHHVDRVGELQDWVADQLTGAVPGDPPAPVDVHHRRTVHRPVAGFGALTRSVHRRVLQQQHGVAVGAAGPLVHQVALPLPGVSVVDHADVAYLDSVVGHAAGASGSGDHCLGVVRSHVASLMGA